MNKIFWVLAATLSGLCSSSPVPGRKDVEDDINQLMSRFMFDDYEPNSSNEYDEYDQAEHYFDEQPSRHGQHTKQNSNYNRQNSQDFKEPEIKNVQNVAENSKEPTKESEKIDIDSATEPTLRDFTLIVSKLLFHLSQM